MNELEIFCRNIKEIREREGLTKKEMAKILDIAIKTLTKMENGIIPPRLSCYVVIRASIKFNIPPSQLFK